MEARVGLSSISSLVTSSSASTTPVASIVATWWRTASNLLVYHLFSSLYGLRRTFDDYIFLSRSLRSILVHLTVSSTVSTDGRYCLTTLAHHQPHLVARNCDSFSDIITTPTTTSSLMITSSRVGPASTMTSHTSSSPTSSVSSTSSATTSTATSASHVSTTSSHLLLLFSNNLINPHPCKFN